MRYARITTSKTLCNQPEYPGSNRVEFDSVNSQGKLNKTKKKALSLFILAGIFS